MNETGDKSDTRPSVLLVDDVPLFESNAIAEYLDETVEPRLHPADPMTRARHRAWTDFTPDFASGLSGVYYAKTKEASEAGHDMARKRLDRIEHALTTDAADGPYFGGETLSLHGARKARIIRLLEKSGGMPEGGRFAVRSVIERWAMEAHVAEAANLSPLIVSNGREDGFMMPDHLSVMAENILRARANMTELRDILAR